MIILTLNPDRASSSLAISRGKAITCGIFIFQVISNLHYFFFFFLQKAVYHFYIIICHFLGLLL